MVVRIPLSVTGPALSCAVHSKKIYIYILYENNWGLGSWEANSGTVDRLAQGISFIICHAVAGRFIGRLLVGYKTNEKKSLRKNDFLCRLNRVKKSLRGWAAFFLSGIWERFVGRVWKALLMLWHTAHKHVLMLFDDSQ